MPDDKRQSTHEFDVPDESVGSRVDVFVTGQLSNCSRAQIQRAASAETLFVNDAPVKSNYRLRRGDRIAITLTRPEPEDDPPQAEDIPLDVVYEDDHIIVINKPAGMVVHPAVGHRTGTLVNALLGHGVSMGESISTQRPGIVHRLDKGTSGLIVCAKTENAHHKLAQQLKDRTLSRQYWAICWGHFKDDEFVIDEPIGRSPSDRKKMAVTSAGRAAKTRIRILERFDIVDLIEATLESGRTHQIRVHLSHHGHPVVGDSDYGGGPAHLKGVDPLKRPFARRIFDVIKRSALHARTLSLDHPESGARLMWSKEPPTDFARLLDLSRGSDG